MEAHLDNPNIEKYLAEILKLDDATKSKIIERISRSFTFRKDDSKVEENAFKNLKDAFGSWDDERSADEIINEIYDARVDKEFDENMFE